MEWLLSSASVAVAALVGWGTYRLSLRNQRLAEEKKKSDAHGELFDDALQLKDEYKAAYDELRVEVHELRLEVEALRKELKEQTRWKEVAVAAYHAWLELVGSSPLWWPPEERHPQEKWVR